MPHTAVNRFVRITCPLGTELPYRPVFAMLGVEEFYDLVERVSVCELRVCFRGSRSMKTSLVSKVGNERNRSDIEYQIIERNISFG
jgi:hypothetical protein